MFRHAARIGSFGSGVSYRDVAQYLSGLIDLKSGKSMFLLLVRLLWRVADHASDWLLCMIEENLSSPLAVMVSGVSVLLIGTIAPVRRIPLGAA